MHRGKSLVGDGKIRRKALSDGGQNFIFSIISIFVFRAGLVKKDPSVKLGESHLFYGCRYKEKDFLYR